MLFPGYICPECGNGVLEASEVCDDYNSDDSDGCSSMCVVENGATCEQNALDISECQLPQDKCGNGELNDDEQCDVGYDNVVDGCDQGVVLDGYTCTHDVDGEPSVCEADAFVTVQVVTITQTFTYATTTVTVTTSVISLVPGPNMLMVAGPMTIG